MSPIQDEPTLQEMSRRLAEVEQANARLHEELGALRGEYLAARDQRVSLSPDVLGVFSSSVSGTPAVKATGTNSAEGVLATSDSGTALHASSDTGTGVFAVSDSATSIFATSNTGTGISGQSPFGTGVVGQSESGTGISAQSESGTGILAQSSRGTGILAQSRSGTGISAQSLSGIGVQGESFSDAGVVGQSDSGTGVFAQSRSGVGVFAQSSSGTGVFAQSDTDTAVLGNSPLGTGIRGQSNSGFGVRGSGSSGAGVFGESSSGQAGLFVGIVQVNGLLLKTAGFFQIDHPIYPAHKFLLHSFVESPDMKNIYDGVVVLDAQGEAKVTLPSWFDALNTDFRYQLTAIGAAGPDLYIAEEISANRFKIAGGKPHMKVCWQVTGIRQDAWAKANPLLVEQDKPEQEQGYYLHPELYGESEQKSIVRARYPELKALVLPEK